MSAAESGDRSDEDASTASSMGGGARSAGNRGAAAAMRRTSGLHAPSLTAAVRGLQQQVKDLATAQKATEDRTAGMYASIMAAMQQPAQAQSAARTDTQAVGTPTTPAPAGGTSSGTTVAAGRSPPTTAAAAGMSPPAMDTTSSSSTSGGPTSLTAPGALSFAWLSTPAPALGAGGA